MPLVLLIASFVLAQALSRMFTIVLTVLVCRDGCLFIPAETRCAGRRLDPRGTLHHANCRWCGRDYGGYLFLAARFFDISVSQSGFG